MILCPHCNQQKIGSGRLPPDVVMILPCPLCHEYSVVFRNRAIPINKRILEKGTRKERIEHLANIIEMFLELVAPQWGESTPSPNPEGKFKSNDDLDLNETKEERRMFRKDYQYIEENYNNNFQAPSNPITEEDVKKFIEYDLKSLDDPDFFKKLFGNID